MRPRLSVITVTYNDPEGLGETLESLRPLQDVAWSWEHVVVDSSTESNAAILRRLPADWPLRHVVQLPRGVYPAMNLGVTRASGDFVWFLNSRDRLVGLPVLAGALDRMEAEEDIGVVCAAVIRTREGKDQYTWKPGRSFFWSTLGANRICHQGMIYRRTAFSQVGNYSERYRLGGDYEHHLRCLFNDVRVELIQEPLASFDVSGLGSRIYRLEGAELKEIHRSFRDRLDPPVRAMHCVARWLHLLSLYAIKCLQGTRAARVLRPAWLAWKNRSAALRCRR